MPVRVTIQDGRLQGARHLAVVSATRVAVAALDRVVMVNPVEATIVGETGALGSKLGPIALVGSKLWTMDEAGTARQFTTADDPGALANVDLDSFAPAWISSSGGFVVAPCGQAGIATLHATSGAILDRCDDVLTKVAFAIAAAGYVYAFDGVGRAAVLTVDADGILTPVVRFVVIDAVGPLSGFIDGDELVVACSRRSLVVTLDLTDPAAPTIASRTRHPGYTLRGVLNDDDRSPLTVEPFADLGLAEWWPADAGVQLADGPFLLHEASGRCTTYQTPAAPDPDVDVTLGYILTEDGGLILTEDGSPLLQE